VVGEYNWSWLEGNAVKSDYGKRLLQLRVAERTLLAFFAALTLASFTLSLPVMTRGVVVLLNGVVGWLVAGLSREDVAARSRMASAVRDWLPALLLLLAYKESGLFARPDPAHRLDHLFILLDRALLGSHPVQGLLGSAAPWLQHYLEFSYLLCYPLVPLGLAALYFAPPAAAQEDARATMLDRFWTTVLLATLFCYAIYPFFPLTPPRVLFHDIPGPAVPPLLRNLNLRLLDWFSVQVCLFPSGHAAAVTATALAVRAYRPRLGLLFCLAALSVAAATVYGRYHYTADAVAGLLVGVGAFLVAKRLQGK
jgi:membrane-associated phospholipid phosphatase